MGERALIRALALAAATLVSLSRCVLQSPGVEVIVVAENVDARAELTDASGALVRVERATAHIAALELLRCPGDAPVVGRGPALHGFGVARAHATGFALEDVVLDLVSPGELGVLAPEPGRYCDVRIRLGAPGLPALSLDVVVVGRSRTIHVALVRETVVRLRDASGAPAVLALDVGDPRAELALAISTAHLLERVTLDALEPERDDARLLASAIDAIEVAPLDRAPLDGPR